MVWTGNRSQRRGSQERKENGTKIDSKRDSNESIRSKGNGAMVSHPPTPTPPLPLSRESPCSYSRTQNSSSPLVPSPTFAQASQTSPLQTPWKSQNPSPRLSHRRPKAVSSRWRRSLETRPFENNFWHSSPEPEAPPTHHSQGLFQVSPFLQVLDSTEGSLHTPCDKANDMRSEVSKMNPTEGDQVPKAEHCFPTLTPPLAQDQILQQSPSLGQRAQVSGP